MTCFTRCLLIAFTFLLMGESAVQSRAADKPNILFIFADDQCFETIGAFGHTDIKTPHLDRLVAQGTTFTHAYNMGSYSGAVCIASRNMLNTGRWLWHSQAIHNQGEKEREAGRWWSEYMKKAGYRTYMTGKWHVRAKAEKAFDMAHHVRPGMPNQTKQGYNRPLPGKKDVWSPYDKKFEGFWKGGTHWSEIVADDTLGFLKDSAKHDKPFFMYMAFNAPHDPRQAPKSYVDMYPLSSVEVPVNFLKEYPYKDAIACGKNLRDEKLGPFPRTHHSVKVHRQEYYAIITHMDAQIGRVLDALEKSGKADNTWIFFTADHGLAVGHHGLFGKQNLYDHSTRVPFMVVGPKVAKGKKINTPIYMQDVMPTTLELAGVKKPEHVQFKSVLPILNGEKKQQYDAIYGGYLNVQRSATIDGWKLILYPNIKKVRLFNTNDDPMEMKDLGDAKAQQGRIKTLFAKLLELQKQTGDKLDLKSVYPNL
jgi:arylsulfatase A-like enzyme